MGEGQRSKNRMQTVKKGFIFYLFFVWNGRSIKCLIGVNAFIRPW